MNGELKPGEVLLTPDDEGVVSVKIDGVPFMVATWPGSVVRVDVSSMQIDGHPVNPTRITPWRKPDGESWSAVMKGGTDGLA